MPDESHPAGTRWVKVANSWHDKRFILRLVCTATFRAWSGRSSPCMCIAPQLPLAPIALRHGKPRLTTRCEEEQKKSPQLAPGARREENEIFQSIV